MSEINVSSQSIRPPEGILRIRSPFHKKGSSRRVSCKDLGNGDCEGWLWKKAEKPGIVSRDWKKFWFTLIEKSLYYYKNKEDDVAQGIFFMPAFIVSPASDKDSSRKFAFKASHQKYGTCLFASERKEDMVKWMNMLQVACLSDYNPRRLDKIDSVPDDYSGSDSEDDRSATSSLYSVKNDTTMTDAVPPVTVTTPDTENHCSSPADQMGEFPANGETGGGGGLFELTPLHRRARSVLERSIKRKSKEDKLQLLYSHLASLQRTLKDKETQLNLLEGFFKDCCPVTSGSLQEFLLSSTLVGIETETTVDGTVDNSVNV